MGTLLEYNTIHSANTTSSLSVRPLVRFEQNLTTFVFFFLFEAPSKWIHLGSILLEIAVSISNKSKKRCFSTINKIISLQKCVSYVHGIANRVRTGSHVVNLPRYYEFSHFVQPVSCCFTGFARFLFPPNVLAYRLPWSSGKYPPNKAATPAAPDPSTTVRSLSISFKTAKPISSSLQRYKICSSY